MLWREALIATAPHLDLPAPPRQPRKQKWGGRSWKQKPKSPPAPTGLYRMLCPLAPLYNFMGQFAVKGRDERVQCTLPPWRSRAPLCPTCWTDPRWPGLLVLPWTWTWLPVARSSGRKTSSQANWTLVSLDWASWAVGLWRTCLILATLSLFGTGLSRRWLAQTINQSTNNQYQSCVNQSIWID